MTVEDLVSRVSLLLFDRFPKGRADFDLTKAHVATFRAQMNRLLGEAEQDAERDAQLTAEDASDDIYQQAQDEAVR